MRRLLLCLVLNQGFQGIAVLHSHGIRFETFIVDPFRLSDSVAENTIEAIIAATKKDVTIRCLESFVWYD